MSLNLYTDKGGSVSIYLSNFIFISKSFIEENNECIVEYQYNLPFSDIWIGFNEISLMDREKLQNKNNYI